MPRGYKQWTIKEVNLAISICDQNNDYLAASKYFNVSTGSIESLYRKHAGKRVVSKNNIKIKKAQSEMKESHFVKINKLLSDGNSWSDISEIYDISVSALRSRYNKMKNKFSHNYPDIHNKPSYDFNEFIKLDNFRKDNLTWKQISKIRNTKVSTLSQRYQRLKRKYQTS